MSNTSMRDDIVWRLMRWHDRECEITADCTTLRQAAETITALRQALRRALVLDVAPSSDTIKADIAFLENTLARYGGQS